MRYGKRYVIVNLEAMLREVLSSYGNYEPLVTLARNVMKITAKHIHVCENGGVWRVLDAYVERYCDAYFSDEPFEALCVIDELVGACVEHTQTYLSEVLGELGNWRCVRIDPFDTYVFRDIDVSDEIESMKKESG